MDGFCEILRARCLLSCNCIVKALKGLAQTCHNNNDLDITCSVPQYNYIVYPLNEVQIDMYWVIFTK